MRIKLLDQKRVFGRVDLQQYIEEHATAIKTKINLTQKFKYFKTLLIFQKLKQGSVWFREMKLWQWTLARI